MQSSFSSLALTGFAIAFRDVACYIRHDVTSTGYWAGACVSASVWLVLILRALGRSLG